MTITYSCVASGRAVLAELALTGGSYQEAAAKVLSLVLLRAKPKTTVQMGSYVYHTLLMDGITYLCATDNVVDMGAPSAFLREVSDTFTRNPLMSQEHFSPSNAVAADFQQVLGQYMMKYNKNQVNSMISTRRSQVIDIKNDMIQNVNIILEKEERLNIFLDGTDDPPTTERENESTETNGKLGTPEGFGETRWGNGTVGAVSCREAVGFRSRVSPSTGSSWMLEETIPNGSIREREHLVPCPH
ncbi:vesicle-associated membrane protein 7-like [Erethizon dorsatum]